MKKAERIPYLILTEIYFPDEGNATLCSFCKYGEWQGCCKDGCYECKHPLWKVNEECAESIQDGPGDGVDCWGFRPLCSREDCVDMVGIWLRGKSVDLSSLPGVAGFQEVKNEKEGGR